MKLSLKKLAVAAALAATAASASAAIDTGANGNGELFFNIWDANGSYSLNLGDISIDSFQSQIAAAGNINLAYNLGTDSVFTSFLSGVADTSALKWNVQAADTSGARRILETYSTMPATAKPNDVTRSAANKVSTLANNINIASIGTDSVAVTSANTAYAGSSSFGDTLTNTLGFSNAGTLSNDSYADGLNFMRIDALATGIAKSTYTQYADGASAVKIYLDANNTLHIAAVPEPESYAMLLAGLGMVGLMARRRLGKRA